MASRDYAVTRQILQGGTNLMARTDTPIAFRIRKVGTETATSVTVTTATNIVLVGSTTTDTIAFATYTTMGAVADAINATGRWEARVLDVLRSTASASNLKDGAITSGTDLNGVTVWDAVLKTASVLQFSLALSTHRDFDVPKGHRVHLDEIRYKITMGTAAANSVQVWLRRGTVEKQVFGILSVQGTDTTISWASGVGAISGGDDDDIIVIVLDAATLADAAGNILLVNGRIE